MVSNLEFVCSRSLKPTMNNIKCQRKMKNKKRLNGK